jgi:hypothetical protein
LDSYIRLRSIATSRVLIAFASSFIYAADSAGMAAAKEKKLVGAARKCLL